MTVILVGMSAGIDPDELTALAADAGAHAAFLQVYDPALVDVLDDAADGGARELLLIGCGWAQPGPKRSWLRRVAAHWMRERFLSGAPVPAVLLAPELLPAAQSHLVAAAVAEGGRPMTPDAAPLVSAAWENVPSHRHQVLVCRGPRCSARGAAALSAALGAELRRRALDDDDVLMTVTGCQFPCNHAPVVTVQPDDAWYGGITVEDVPALVEDHLVDGRRLAHRLLPRARSTPPEYSDRSPGLRRL